MREKVTVEYISFISTDGVPYIVNGEVYRDQLEVLPEYKLPVLKSLNAKSTASLLNDLHDHAVNCDDGKMIELVADVMQRVKELETKCRNYKTKLEHIRHDLDEK
jgi:hypothetical protein